MNLQNVLNEKGISRYYLSKISGVAYTTITDVCTGKSSIERCSAKTVFMLAKALNCSMEQLLQSDESNSKDYLECGLPEYLNVSIRKMKKAWEKKESGEKYLRWDCDFCDLQTDINCAETDGEISSEQAWYLREKYLKIKRNDLV